VARDWIVSRYGQQFDPMVVEAFIAREQDFYRISVGNQDLPLEAYLPAENELVLDAGIDSAIIAAAR
jgi:hypothetical protein